MTEAQIMDAVMLAVNRGGDVVLFRNNVGMAERAGRTIRFGVGGKGGADLLGIFRGRFIAAEIKTPVGRQTPEQRAFEQLVTGKQADYVVLRSVDDAERWLVELDRKYPQ